MFFSFPTCFHIKLLYPDIILSVIFYDEKRENNCNFFVSDAFKTISQISHHPYRYEMEEKTGAN